jgi:SAM-dependent methyltransferase
MLTRDDVVGAYRYFLGREPESEAVIRSWQKVERIDDLRAAFMKSDEFQAQIANARSMDAPLIVGRHASSPRMDVELAGPPEELARMFEHVKRSWEEFGEQEPYWSVLAADDFKQDSIKTTKDRFYRSGYDVVDVIKAFFSRNGQSLASVTSCLELGCGVARVTSALAGAVPRVYGVDISTAHIALAKKSVASQNIRNASFIHLDRMETVRTLPRHDLFFSIIVLQHNAPPIMEYLLDNIFARVNGAGYVLFQIPTYCEGYSFRWKDYLGNMTTGMEMHALPQERVFDLCARHGIRLIEIQEDSWTASPAFRSNSFFGRKAA